MAVYTYRPAFLAGIGLTGGAGFQTVFTAPPEGAVVKHVVLTPVTPTIVTTTATVEVMVNGFPTALVWDMQLKTGTTVTIDVDVPLENSNYSIRAKSEGHPVDMILTGFRLTEVN